MMRLGAAGPAPPGGGAPGKGGGAGRPRAWGGWSDGWGLAGRGVGERAAGWPARRAAAAEGAGGDGGAWLEGKAAKAMACDAVITPVVTGDIDPGVLDDLVRLCVELD